MDRAHVRLSRRAGVSAMAGLACTALVAGLGAAAPVVAAPGSGSVAAADVERQVLDELATGGTSVFWVYLHDRADLSPATTMTSRAAQGELVYERLTDTARQSQANLRAVLDAEGVDYQTFWIANAVRVTGDAALLREIAARPEVAQVTADRTYAIPEPAPAADPPTVAAVEWGIDRINAPQVWDELGATGEGIVVGSIDTGVQFDHPALMRQYRGSLGDGEFDHDYNWWDPSQVCGEPSLAPCDNIGHGTHVTGTMVGDDGAGNQVGVAPGARWIAAKGCETRNCSQEALLSSAQFMLAPTDLAGENPDPARRPHIINNSWGGLPTTDPWYRPTVQAWLAAGIFPQFANGNTDFGVARCGSSSNPGNLPESYAAGAFDINNRIANFSNRGPSAWADDLIKPNLAAPGVAIRSTLPGDRYGSFDGTSMASPHVAGTVALMWSAAPAIARDIEATRELLDLTAIDIEDLSCGGTAENNNVWGQGRLDAYAAVESSPRGPTGRVGGTVTDAATGQPVTGATVTVTGAVRRQRITGPDGGYSIPLPVGEYDVTAAAFGYEPQTIPVPVAEDTITGQDFPLAANPGPSLQLAPGQLDFGKVPVGKVGGPRALTITGGGVQPVTIQALSDPGAGFTVAGGSCGAPPFTLARFESCTVDYAFLPAVQGLAAATVSVTSDAAGSPHTAALRGVGTPAVADQLWVARHNGPADRNDVVHALAPSPDGARVFVAGQSFGGDAGNDYATAGYDAATGEELWLTRYTGPGGGTEGIALGLAVSPDGARVYVTGRSAGLQTGNDYATVAYDAATGEELWLARYDGPGSGADVALAIGISPDGAQVYVTGQSERDGGWDYATVGYDAATGTQQWLTRYQGPGDSFGDGLAVSPDGAMVFVTGRSLSPDTGNDYATVGYDAATGAERWVTRYDGPPSSQDFPEAMGVGPDGTVFVTGRSFGQGTGTDYATVGYHPATGVERWVARYDGPVSGADVPNGLAVSPDGTTVVVTGQSEGAVRRRDYGTVAYDAATGAERWVARYNGPASRNDFANTVAVSPDSARVYVTGSSSGEGTGTDYGTLGYDAATGDELWLSRYDGPGSAQEIGNAVAVSPDGTQVYVSGGSTGEETGLDFTTVAYDAGVVACDRTLTGRHVGPLTVTGEVLCLDGARIVGPVQVRAGAGLVSVDATVTGPVTAAGAAVLELTGTRLAGAVTASGVTDHLVLAGNQLTGPVRLTGNTTGANSIVVSGNRIVGPLSCTGNQPPPTNLGEPNAVTGPRSGQCAEL